MAFPENSCGIMALDLALAGASGKEASVVHEESGMVTSNGGALVVFGHHPHPKVRVPSQMKPFKHEFYTVENNIIVNYDFTLLKTDVTVASELFRVSLSVTRNCLILDMFSHYSFFLGRRQFQKQFILY